MESNYTWILNQIRSVQKHRQIQIFILKFNRQLITYVISSSNFRHDLNFIQTHLQPKRKEKKKNDRNEKREKVKRYRLIVVYMILYSS